MPTQLFFDLDHFDRWHRADWEDRLSGWLGNAPAEIGRVESAAAADFVIEPFSQQSFIGGRAFTIAPHSHYHRRPETTFAWDSGDHPTGLLPGLYCSLNHRLSDSTRHRGFCYPLRMNRLVCECPLEDARYLAGFSGNITSPLRAKLFPALRGMADAGRAHLRRTESIFHRIYSPETDVERARFVDDLRISKFVLCPRGNGLSSIRLFESLESARVPVIISDALVLPQCVEWKKCSVRIREKDIGRIPEILEAREPEWKPLARQARLEWERCFGDTGMLTNLVGQLWSIVEARANTETVRRHFAPFRMLPDYAIVHAKTLIRRLRR